MELTLDAVENPFGLSLDDDETANLTRLGSDPHVRRVLVLPSFKLKKETLRWLGRDIRNTRCDDTVVLADGLHPRYANYEIGCGFFSVLVDLDATPETSRGITEAVRRFVRAHNGFSDRVRRVTSSA
ncbi:MAG TPA: hypothetical protein VKP64_16035 [Mycobacteriales bacterium]|nr:hypothetical protein [Mycobacteriales bacterium]